jgi:hypothetical protein
MSKIDEYRQTLQNLADWDEYLLSSSGLPGPRGNLELAQAVAALGDRQLFARFREYDPQRAPANTPQEFLAFCGVLGLGVLIAAGERELLATLRTFAADPRWRIREAVAMAQQRLGASDIDALLQEMEAWSAGSCLEQRAAAAALAEPALLGQAHHVSRALAILDNITAAFATVVNRKSDEYKALKKGLGYCWSVLVAALPEEGRRWMEKWFACQDPDVRWVMKENLKKKRLERMDAAWVSRWQEQL